MGILYFHLPLIFPPLGIFYFNFSLIFPLIGISYFHFPFPFKYIWKVRDPGEWRSPFDAVEAVAGLSPLFSQQFSATFFPQLSSRSRLIAICGLSPLSFFDAVEARESGLNILFPFVFFWSANISLKSPTQQTLSSYSSSSGGGNISISAATNNWDRPDNFAQDCINKLKKHSEKSKGLFGNFLQMVDLLPLGTPCSKKLMVNFAFEALKTHF